MRKFLIVLALLIFRAICRLYEPLVGSLPLVSVHNALLVDYDK